MLKPAILKPAILKSAILKSAILKSAILKSASVLTVLALAAGLAAGAAVGFWGTPEVKDAVTTFEAVGSLWLNGLRMTVVPLVFSLLVIGVASVADAAATGRLAARSILIMAVMLITATAYATLALPAAFSLWPVDPAAGAAFVAGAGAQPVEPVAPPTFGEWLTALAPSNPIAAAAESAILPLTVFALFFGFACTRLPAVQRDLIVAFFRAVADAMIVIVRWVLIAAPVGVFALSLGVGLRSGFDVAGLLVQYVVVASVITAGVAVIAIMFAILWGRASPGTFLSASAPVLAVAFSTQSSLASLPLMVERARDAMGVPDRVANLVLPLAVAVFRMTSPVTNLAAAFFVAQVYGIDLTPGQIFAGALVAIPISIGSVGLPGQVSFIASVGPICLAMGLPLDVLGILLAVEVIPDIFRTVGNVTGDMAAVATANRSAARPEESTEAGSPAASPPA
jgi:Na+/H+-dicarboxylate symporter